MRLIAFFTDNARQVYDNAKILIEEEEEVYLQIQKVLKPMRIQTIICTYMVMAGTVLICIE